MRFSAQGLRYGGTLAEAFSDDVEALEMLRYDKMQQKPGSSGRRAAIGSPEALDEPASRADKYAQ